MAARFWVGGTGTWDGSTTTHWASSTGGAGGQSVPGVNDTVTLDGSSGGGTVTVNTTVTVQSITCGAFTGTLDFSANNNNVTLSANAGFNGSGTGARTINLGNGRWTLSANASNITPWNMATTTGLTFNANGSTISLTGVQSTQKTFAGGGLSYNIVSFGPNSSGGVNSITVANTFAGLTLLGPVYLQIPASTTQIVTTLTSNGSAAGQIFIESQSPVNIATISIASGAQTLSWTAPRGITFTGGATFVAGNSFDLGNNTGITITPPTMTRSRGWSGFA